VHQFSERASVHEGLERISHKSFHECKSLECISVPLSVQMICQEAFIQCSHLMHVHLNKGLRKIELYAFCDCTSLLSVVIPSTVEVIEESAFANCQALVNVQLTAGLMEIGAKTFRGCISLEQITLPSTVNKIGWEVFKNCQNLVNVQLKEGLKTIGGQVFLNCTSLEQIVIPSTVADVQSLDVFKNCKRLVKAKFVDEVEEFVSETSLRTWWDKGVARHLLSTYSFLAKHDIVKRFGMLQATKWRNTILDMLECIPYEKQPSHFKSIHSMLIVYHRLGEVAVLLELALWKSKIFEHGHCRPNSVDLSSDEMQQLRMDCGSAVIIPNVLSFLLVDKPGLL
jgi:hypothetical protein